MMALPFLERHLGLERDRGTAGQREREESVVAERILVVLLAILRTGTLVLGAAEITSSSRLVHPAAAIAALSALATASAVVFALAALRLRRGVTPALDERTAVVEIVAGVAGLLVVAYATPLSLRTTSTFWIEPYTVITAIMLAAAARRVAVGAAGAACLAVTYLLCVFVWSIGGMHLSSTARATALANAISYLPFFAIGAIGFATLRFVMGQTDELRRELRQLSAERARLKAADTLHRIGHDNPKAILRQVRRGWMTTDRLRPLAIKYRNDLLIALGDEERPEVSLHDELAALAGALAASAKLQIDLEELDQVPAGAPTLLIREAVRELLNNASFHAYGFPAALTARSSPKRVEVTVHNDGKGVDPVMVAALWTHKQNTLHHLQVAGGAFEVRSRDEPSAGVTVTVTWPADDADDGDRIAPTGTGAHARASKNDTGDHTTP
jgi:hypothetical protein